MKKLTKAGLAGVVALAMGIGFGSCENPSSKSLSADAALGGLSVSGVVWQNAEFNPDVTAYDFVVENTTESVAVEAQARNGAARVEGAGALTLKEGDNQHIVKVTAEDGAGREYKLTITRLDVNGMGATEAAVECLPNQGAAGDMVVTWKPVYGAESYIVSYGISGSDEVIETSITGNPLPTTYTISGLAEDSTYFVWVLAKKGDVEKSFSVAKSVTAPDAFDTLEELKTYLSSLPQNTSKTAYRVKLSGAVETCSRIEHLGLAGTNHTLGGLWDALAGKYAYADLSAIKGTELINSEGTGVPGSDKLTGIILPGELEFIGSRSFKNYESLTEVIFPDTLKEIGQEAFVESTIKTIRLSPALEIIDRRAFLSSALETVTSAPAEKIPEGVRLTFGEGVFGNCSNLKEVILPDSFSSGTTSSFYSCPSLTKFSIPAMTTKISDTFLASVDIRFEVRGEGNFSTGDGGKMLVQANIGMIVAWPSMEGDVEIPEDVFALAPQFFAGNTTITSVILPSGITYLPEGLFSTCANLQQVDIRGNVTTIGRFAFRDCTSLTTIELPESLQTIGYQAFMQSGLTSITIPRNVRAYAEESGNGSRAFDSCNALIEVVVKTKLLAVNLFRECANLETVTLAADTRVIPVSTFYNCPRLKKINPAEGGNSVNFPSGIVDIGGGAFTGTDLEGEIILPASLSSFNRNTFDNCKNITKIDIPGTSLAAFTLGANDILFSGCTGIEEFVISGPNSSQYTVAGEGRLLIKDNQLIRLAAGATSLTLPQSIISFHSKAFEKCNNVQTIAVEGGSGPWSVADDGHLLIQNNNKLMFAANIEGTLTIPSAVTAWGTAPLMEKDKVREVVFNCSSLHMLNSKLSGCTNLTTVTFGESFGGSIPTSMFQNTGLTSITIPASVTSISASAFNGCTQLTEVILMRTADTTALANISAFTGCTALESVWVPPSLVDNYKTVNLTSNKWGALPNSAIIIKDGTTRNPAISYL